MGTPDNSLELLMKKAQQGDRHAYADLLRQISPLIRSFLRRRLGPRADNEDVLQEVLMAIHKASHTYNTERPFKAWMFAIADYKVKDYLRAHYRRFVDKQVDFAEVENFLIDPVTSEPSPAELLNEVLGALPEKQQKIVRLMKIEGYTADEVANEMKMSTSAVKVTAHRAYKLLKKKQQKGML